MHQVSFDPVGMKGTIITNTSLVEKERLDETLAVFYDTIQSGLSVSPLIKLGEEKRLIKIKTACSLTISGVLLKSGIPVRPKGGSSGVEATVHGARVLHQRWPQVAIARDRAACSSPLP